MERMDSVQRRFSPRGLLGVGLLLAIWAGPAAAVGLDEAIAIAQEHDPWLAGSRHRQAALAAESVAANSLPDPMLSLGFANLPTDSFDFDQEAMTQFKLGLSQTIPRGDSRALQQRQLQLMGEQQPHQRRDRRAQVALEVSHLWLDGYLARESIRLIEEDRAIFEQLVDVAESSYSAALGATRQQDLVRAQLELTRLEDRLTALYEQGEVAQSRLGQWLPPGAVAQGGQWTPSAAAGSERRAGAWQLALLRPELLRRAGAMTPGDLTAVLISHPAVRNLDARIAAAATGVKIAEQQYRPEWRLNASYGYRDDAPDGPDRADFFSVGVAFDLPLFTENRQDQQRLSAIAGTEAVRTERALLLRRMAAGLEAQRAKLRRLEQRAALYQSRLLLEIHEQAEASLTAYTNDDGDFAEVVRSRIAELNARIDALKIEVDRLKTIAQLNYFLAGTTAEEPR